MQADFTSRLAAGWLADGALPNCQKLVGSAVLADLSGFTRLTELLMRSGPEGVEVLHQVMTRCFAQLLGRSLGLGGDVIGMAGDAALVWFSGTDHVQRAVEAAGAMPKDLSALAARATGGRRLHVSVGVHTGIFDVVLAGSIQRALCFCGPETSLLARLQGAAQRGQVLMSPALAGVVRPSRRGPALGPGVVLRGRATSIAGDDRQSNDQHSAIGATDHPQVAAHDLQSLVSPSVFELLNAGITLGDHRTVSVGFVMIPHLDQVLARDGLQRVHDVIEHVVDTATHVSRDLSIDWLDTDIGDGSVKLLLASGAPRSIDHDEDRLLLALRRIVDESRHPLRAGGQRGRVFFGPLGLPGRRTYTILGDPANVAARALSLADDRQVVVGDRLVGSDRLLIARHGLGSCHLKNRVKPVSMWQIDAVIDGRVDNRTTTSARSGLQSVVRVAGTRHAQSEQLANAWKRTIDGTGCVVSVTGDPGMGASQLLAEIVARAGSSATAISADPFGRHIPYGALSVIVRNLARQTDGNDGNGGSGGDGRNDGSGDFDGDGWSWIGGFTPQLPAYMQGWVTDALAMVTHGGSANADPRTASSRAQVVLTELLVQAMPVPHLLAIDDVDMIDDASRRILGQLRSSTKRRPLMIVTSSVAAVETVLEPFPATMSIVLAPLEPAEAAELVETLAPSLRAAHVDRIVRAANGNPLVLSELARQPNIDELPDSLQRLGAVLIDSLEPRARALVRDASVFGDPLPLALIADVLARPDLVDPDAWTNLAPVVHVHQAGISFRHDVYRRMAYQSLPFARRRQLHRSLADHLVVTGRSDHALLAFHYQQAGRVDLAYPSAVRAGMAAKSSGALVEASDLLGRAATMAGQIDRASMPGLLIEQGESFSWLGEFDAAEGCFRSARRRVTDPIEHGRLCHLQADMALTHNKFRTAQRWIDQGLAATDQSNTASVAVRCHLLLDLAARRDLAGDHRGSLTIAEQALALANRVDQPILAGLAHLHLEMAYSTLMEDEAVAHGDAAVAIFEEIGHDRYLNSALSNSGLTAMYRGQWDDAIDRYRRAVDHAHRSGHTHSAAIAEMNIGYLLYRQRRLDDADDQSRRAMRTLRNLGITKSLGYVLLLQSHIAAAMSRPGDAAELLEAAHDAFVQVGDAAMVVDCLVSGLEHLVNQRRFAEVLERAPSVEAAMANAETEARITYDRTLGIAQAALGRGDGWARVSDALALARRHSLKHDVYQCLSAMILIDSWALTSDGEALQGLIAERESIGASLGIVEGLDDLAVARSSLTSRGDS